MSDLANAVFGGQLIGHVIAGEELTQSVVTDAAMTASLADGMSVGDGSMSDVEQKVLEARVAHTVAEDGDYSPADLLNDQMHAEIDASLAEDLMF